MGSLLDMYMCICVMHLQSVEVGLRLALKLLHTIPTMNFKQTEGEGKRGRRVWLSEIVP